MSSIHPTYAAVTAGTHNPKQHNNNNNKYSLKFPIPKSSSTQYLPKPNCCIYLERLLIRVSQVPRPQVQVEYIFAFWVFFGFFFGFFWVFLDLSVSYRDAGTAYFLFPRARCAQYSTATPSATASCGYTYASAPHTKGTAISGPITGPTRSKSAVGTTLCTTRAT